MANMLIPVEERNLTPDEVTRLDRRRRRGHLLLNLGWQTLIVSVLLTLWSGQDLTYSPGWNHWIFYWNCVTAFTSLVCFATGLRLRRGLNEFFSY
jgi:hypothetical protein